MPRKKWLWVLLGLILFAGFFVWKERSAAAHDQPTSWQSLRDANKGLLALALVVMIASQAPLLAMWVYLCRRAGLAKTFGQLYAMFAAMLFLGANTPGRSGEMALPLMDRENLGRLGSVVVINRVLGFLFTAGLALFFVVMCMSQAVFPARQGAMVFVLVGILAGIIVTALNRRVLTWGVGLVFRIAGRFERIALFAKIVALKPRVDEEIGRFYDAIGAMIHLRGLVWVFLLQVAAYGLIVIANWLTLKSLGVEAGAINVLGVMAAMSLAGLVTLTPGGMGFGEFFAEGVFTLYGVAVPASFYALIRLMMQIGLPAFYLLTARLVARGRVAPGGELPIEHPPGAACHRKASAADD